MGNAVIEHHRAAIWRGRQNVITHWKFVTRLGDRVVHELTRDFHWTTMSYERSEDLLVRSGFTVVEEYGGFGREPFIRGESDKRIVVAALA